MSRFMILTNLQFMILAYIENTLPHRYPFLLVIRSLNLVISIL